MAGPSGIPMGPTMQSVPSGSLRRPRILVAACGCLDAAKFGQICRSLTGWAEVKAVATRAGLFLIDRATIPRSVNLYTDEDELYSWSKLRVPILHIELCQWADLLLIAPLSANTLAKIDGGLCDNLLTRIVRAWDYTKLFLAAPSMQAFTWRNPFTERQLTSLNKLGIIFIPPFTTIYMGDDPTDTMAPLSNIQSVVKFYIETRFMLGGGKS